MNYPSSAFSGTQHQLRNLIVKNLPKLLVLALSQKKYAWKHIHSEYNRDSQSYHNYYKNSDLSKDSSLFVFPVDVEIYMIQSIGIVEFAFSTGNKRHLTALLKKSYKEAFRYVESNSFIIADEFMRRNIKNKKTNNSLSFDNVFGDMIALFYFAWINKEKSFGSSEDSMGMLLQQIDDPNRIETKINALSQTKEAREKLCRDIGLNYPKKDCSILDFFSEYSRKEISRFSEAIGPFPNFLDSLGIDSLSINSTKKLTVQDYELCLQEVVYNIENGMNEEFALLQLITYLHTLSFSYVYKEAKKMATVKNAEQRHEEIKEITIKYEKQIHNNLKLEKKQKEIIQENKAKDLEKNERIKELEKELKQLHHELRQQKSYKKEVVALRNYAYQKELLSYERRLSNKKELSEEIYESIKEEKIAFLGGHINWLNKIKEKLPNSRNVGTQDINKDFSFINKMTVLVINTQYINHSMYRKMMKEIENSTIKILYINEGASIDQLFQQINEVLNVKNT